MRGIQARAALRADQRGPGPGLAGELAVLLSRAASGDDQALAVAAARQLHASYHVRVAGR